MIIRSEMAPSHKTVTGVDRRCCARAIYRSSLASLPISFISIQEWSVSVRRSFMWLNYFLNHFQESTTQKIPIRNEEDSAIKDEMNVESSVPENPLMKKVSLALKVVLWFALWGIFVELQFGAVYLICSMFLFIYLGTRTNKKKSEPSAYSVFNENCERIQGTYTAEQFESQVLHRPPPLSQSSWHGWCGNSCLPCILLLRCDNHVCKGIVDELWNMSEHCSFDLGGGFLYQRSCCVSRSGSHVYPM